MIPDTFLTRGAQINTSWATPAFIQSGNSIDANTCLSIYFTKTPKRAAVKRGSGSAASFRLVMKWIVTPGGIAPRLTKCFIACRFLSAAGCANGRGKGANDKKKKHVVLFTDAIRRLQGFCLERLICSLWLLDGKVRVVRVVAGEKAG